MSKIVFVDCPSGSERDYLEACMRFINQNMGAPGSLLRTFGPSDPPTFEGATGNYEIPNVEDRYWRIAGHVIAAFWLGSDMSLWTYDSALGAHLKHTVDEYTRQNETRNEYRPEFDHRHEYQRNVYDEPLTNERRFPSIRLTIDPQFGSHPHVRDIVAGFKLHGREFILRKSSDDRPALGPQVEHIAVDEIGRVQFVCGFIEEVQRRDHAITDLQAITHSHDFENAVNNTLLCTRRNSRPVVSWFHEYPASMVPH